jgi:hypothetical protein
MPPPHQALSLRAFPMLLAIGREKKSRLHRWVVPARAEGLWCGPGDVQLRVTQRYQMVQAQWRQDGREWALQGRLDGRQLRLVGAAPGVWTARVDDDQLVLNAAGAPRTRPRPGQAAASLPPLHQVSGPACRG